MKKIIFIAVIALTLCSSCSEKQKIQWVGSNNDTTQVKKTLVPFSAKENGHITLQASLNGVPFNMIFDTGATGSTISVLELINLIKEGKIDADDILDYSPSMLADGSQMIGLEVTIKDFSIQGQNNESFSIPDVKVTVVDNAEAPILLGMDVIGKLPKHSFNYETNMIEFDKE